MRNNKTRTNKELFLGCPNDKDAVTGEGRGHGVQINIVRDHVLLLEGLAAVGRLDAQLVAVQLDRDVVRRELLHVEGQLVLVALFYLEENGGLRRLGGRRHVVLRLLDLVVHLLWWRRGHGG